MTGTLNNGRLALVFLTVLLAGTEIHRTQTSTGVLALMSQAPPAYKLSAHCAHTDPPTIPPSRGAPLIDFPSDATFRIWRKPTDGVLPVNGGDLHISELITSDGEHVLVCMASMATDDWQAIKLTLVIGEQLGLRPILVATLNHEQIACGLCGAGSFAGEHGLTCKPTWPTVFSPNRTLMSCLGIGTNGLERTRNALVLIRDGHIVSRWVARRNHEGHDWTEILSTIHKA